MARCVVLLSGGLDSATTLALAKELGFEPFALTVLYGQRHSAEIEAAKRVAQNLGVSDHKFVQVALDQFGGSALTDKIEVPKDRTHDAIAEGIPVTYVPARNTVLLALALGYCEVLGAEDLFVGVNAIDYSGYPDCRPAFLQAFERLARLATKSGVSGSEFRIHAPLIQLTKAQIIQEGLRLGLDYGLTLSCYDPGEDGTPCTCCDACTLRAKGFAEVGIQDPAIR